MNTWESKLIDAIKKVCAAEGAQIIYDGTRLCTLIAVKDPSLAAQREYKNFCALMKCEGNQLLLNSFNGSKEAQQKMIDDLMRRMGKEYAIDRKSGERTCALFLTAVSNDSSYLNKLDAPQPPQKPTPQPPQKPMPKPEQKPTQKPTPQSEQKPTPQPEQKPTPQPEQKPAPQPEQKPTPQSEQKPATSGASGAGSSAGKKKKKGKKLLGILVSLVVMLVFGLIGSNAGSLFAGKFFSGRTVIGTWSTQLDVTSINAQAFEDGVALWGQETADLVPNLFDYCDNLYMTLTFEFREDGTCLTALDATALMESFDEKMSEPLDRWISAAVKQIGEQMGVDYESAGLTENDVVRSSFGMSKAELIEYMLPRLRSMMTAGGPVDAELGYYKVQDGRIYCSYSPISDLNRLGYYTYTLKGNTLVLEEAVGLDEMLQSCYPQTLTRVK